MITISAVTEITGPSGRNFLTAPYKAKLDDRISATQGATPNPQVSRATASAASTTASHCPPLSRSANQNRPISTAISGKM